MYMLSQNGNGIQKRTLNRTHQRYLMGHAYRRADRLLDIIRTQPGYWWLCALINKTYNQSGHPGDAKFQEYSVPRPPPPPILHSLALR